MLYNTNAPIAKRVIDSNNAIDSIVARLREESSKQQAQETARTEDGSGFTEGLVFAPLDGEAQGDAEAPPKEPVLSEQEIKAKEQAELIISSARDKAAAILMEAREQAEAESNSIKDKAREEGFSSGVTDGKAQIDEMARENEARFNERLAALDEEYYQKAEALEGDIVGATISVFEKVFGLELTGSEAVLVHLVKSAVMEADNAKEFHIRVSRDDAPRLREYIGDFKACVGNDCTLEVLSDNSLLPGQCLIETEGGVFDCGAGLQMSNIFRNLRALAGI